MGWLWNETNSTYVNRGSERESAQAHVHSPVPVPEDTGEQLWLNSLRVSPLQQHWETRGIYSPHSSFLPAPFCSALSICQAPWNKSSFLHFLPLSMRLTFTAPPPPARPPYKGRLLATLTIKAIGWYNPDFPQKLNCYSFFIIWFIHSFRIHSTNTYQACTPPHPDLVLSSGI